MLASLTTSPRVLLTLFQARQFSESRVIIHRKSAILNHIPKEDSFFSDLDLDYLNAPLNETLDAIRRTLAASLNSFTNQRQNYILSNFQTATLQDFVEVLHYQRAQGKKKQKVVLGEVSEKDPLREYFIHEIKEK